MVVYILTETDYEFNTTKVVTKIGEDGYNYGEDAFILDQLIEKHKSVMMNEYHMNEAECNASIKSFVKKDGLSKVEISSPHYSTIHLEFHKVEINLDGMDN